MIDKALILNRIKNHYGIVKDADFAKFLEITPQVLSNWKSRSTFDPVIIYTKCLDIDPGWLLTGEGEMLKQGKKNDYTPTDYSGMSVVNEPKETYSPAATKLNVSPKHTKNVSPTVSPTRKNTPEIDEKERLIQAQREIIQGNKETIQELKETIKLLQMRVDDKEDVQDHRGKEAV